MKLAFHKALIYGNDHDDNDDDHDGERNSVKHCKVREKFCQTL